MTETARKTAEEIVADAITAYWEDKARSGPNRGPVGHDAECGKAGVDALRAAGLLVGEPTEEQIEEILKSDPRICYPDGGPVNWGYHARRIHELLPAAGVSPQAESAPSPAYENSRAEADRRYLPRDRQEMITERCSVEAFVDGAEWQAALTSPVEVDEEQLAYAIREALAQQSVISPMHYADIAAGVAAKWLRGDRSE